MIFSSLSVSSLLTLVLLPVMVIGALSILLLPALLQPGAKPAAVARALYCCLLQAMGVAVMSIGGLPAVYGVLRKFSTGVEQFGPEAYLAFLILFCAGGITFLWHEQATEDIDDASKRIPILLYWYAFKVLGYLLVLYSGLSILLSMLLVSPPLPMTWWITPLVLFLYGILLCWCTRSPADIPSSFSSLPMHGRKLAFGRGKKR